MDSNNTSMAMLNLVDPAKPRPEELLGSAIATLSAAGLGILANVLCIAAICVNKNLHTSCFAVIAVHALCNWVLAVGFITSGLIRTGLVSVQRTRGSCLTIFMTHTISNPTAPLMQCVIGVERFLAMAFPIWFRDSGGKALVISCTACIIMAMCNGLIAVLTAPGSFADPVMCMNVFAGYHPTFSVFFTNQNSALCFLSVCIYAMFGLKILRDKRKLEAKNNKVAPALKALAGATVKYAQKKKNPNDKFLQIQLELLPVIKLVMLSYVILDFFPDSIVFLSSVVAEGRFQPRVVTYAAILRSTSTCTDFCILALKSTEFASTLKKMFRFR